MRHAPSAELMDLLAQLKLASPEQVRGVRRYAQSLARDLPLFDSVWVDALMRRRLLTPYQAAEINAGRGAELALGPTVICHLIERLGYAVKYLASHRETGELVELTVAKVPRLISPASAALELKHVAEQLGRAHLAETAQGVVPMETGLANDCVWVLHPLKSDMTLRECLTRGGRLTAELVLEIARQVASQLAAIEHFSLVHGDLSVSAISIDEAGQVRLSLLGLRSIVRPGEGYAHADLNPQAYDYLAPERIATGASPDTATDLYACGCILWHLLAGRAPLAGGDSLSKIKAAHLARIVPILRLAPETPALLAKVISRLTQPQGAERGASFAELSAELGPSLVSARQALADYVQSLRPTKPSAQITVCRMPVASEIDYAKKPLSVRFVWRGWSQVLFKPKAAYAFAASACLLVTLLGLWFQGRLARERPSAGTHGAIAINPVSEETAPPLLSREQTSNAIALTDSTQNGRTKADGGSTASALEAGDQAQLASHDEALPPASTTSMHESNQVLPIRELVLPANRPVLATSLELHAGMRVAPAAGSRAKIEVPARGWRIDVNDLRFENVDFVSAHSGQAEGTENNCLVRLMASSAQFYGCTFRAESGDSQSPGLRSAIYWLGAHRQPTLDRLPSIGQLLLANCSLINFCTGIDCRRTGPVVLELDNVLFAAPADVAKSGAVWRLDRCPASEDSLVLRMNACTIRDAMSLVDIYYSEIPADPGQIQLETIDCVFVPRSTGALLRMVGTTRPDRLLRAVTWEGRGSLLPIQGRFGLWYDAQGAPHVLDDANVNIDGLVRGGVEFAGPNGDSPLNSALTHWSAPLIGDTRPGVRVSALPPADLR